MRIVFIFVDGLGLGTPDQERNPCAKQGLEILACFEKGNGSVSRKNRGVLVPTEATLDVQGLPQSATGQTTLLTGVNCSKLLGKHLQGYPNEKLREVLQERSILKQVRDMGLRSAFINTYRPPFFSLKEKIKWRLSTTTVATLSADLSFFSLEDLRQKNSIYHDFTNEILIAQGFDVPCFSPSEAARILARISEKYELLLYEYFLTDRAGHSQDMERACGEVQKLEKFLSTLLQTVDMEESLIMLTSDHGNIEDLSTKTHTRNRVATLLWGCGSEEVKNRIRSLEDITPSILWLLKEAQ